MQFRGVCDFNGEVGDIREPNRLLEVIDIGADVGIGTAGSTITASVAVQLEGFSLVVVAYTLLNDGGNSVAIVRHLTRVVESRPVASNWSGQEMGWVKGVCQEVATYSNLRVLGTVTSL